MSKNFDRTGSLKVSIMDQRRAEEAAARKVGDQVQSPCAFESIVCLCRNLSFLGWVHKHNK